MKKILYLVSISVLFFTSCIPNPEEDPDPVVNVNDILVKKVTEIGTNGVEYSVEFTYSGKKFAQSIDSDGIRTVYTYEQDLIVKEESYDGTILVEKATYVYDISNNLVTYVDLDYVTNSGERWVYVHNSNGTISYQEFTGDLDEQTQADVTGSISGTQYIENTIDPITQQTQVFTEVFTYDTKNFPFKNVTGLSKVCFVGSESTTNNNNNIISQTDQIDDATPEILYNIAYVYNTNNFPVTSTVTSGNGVIRNTEKFIYY